jgi:DNA-directed RNA polymerase, mitochondrial
VGDSRGDLYEVVAQLLTAKARADLESESPGVRMCAEMALEWGITRSLCKPAVLARPYGGTLWTLSSQLVEARDEFLGGVSNKAFHYRVALPAEYLASRMWRILCKVTARLMRFQLWAKRAARLVIAAGGDVVVTTPTGLRLQLGERAVVGRQYHSWLAGRACISTVMQEEEKKWSPDRTATTISPNWTHSFDAALCAMVAAQCGREGIPLLTNHDCFAAPPWAASRLKALLNEQVRGLYATDWLAVQREELMLSAGVQLPELPERGELDPDLIGQNPYLFS